MGTGASARTNKYEQLGSATSSQELRARLSPNRTSSGSTFMGTLERRRTMRDNKPTHVAIVGAGFVGTNCAFALILRGTGARVTLTDVNAQKVEGEVLDLQDGGGGIDVAGPEEAGQADVIVITAGRGQKSGETRLDLMKANAAIMRSVINGMKPLNPSAKILVVSNPCDVLTWIAQETSELPVSQVFGSGTVLDTWRLRVALAERIDVHYSNIDLLVLGEHGDSQFPVPSLANVGGVPLKNAKRLHSVDVKAMAKETSNKAYEIIAKKGHTAFGVAQAVQLIVDCLLNDRMMVLPVSVRVPGRNCCTSLPSVIGIRGIDRVLDHVIEYFDEEEKMNYNRSIQHMEAAIASMKS